MRRFPKKLDLKCEGSLNSDTAYYLLITVHWEKGFIQFSHSQIHTAHGTKIERVGKIVLQELNNLMEMAGDLSQSQYMVNFVGGTAREIKHHDPDATSIPVADTVIAFDARLRELLASVTRQAITFHKTGQRPPKQSVVQPNSTLVPQAIQPMR